jgi:hypothetical protein
MFQARSSVDWGHAVSSFSVCCRTRSGVLSLEAVLGADGRAQLSWFGPPGSAVRLETSNGLTNDWTFWREVRLSCLSTNVSPVPLHGRTLLIRARRQE